MKKVVLPTLLIILALIIAFSYCACRSEGDDSANIHEPPVSVDTVLQERIDSFVTNVPHIGRLGMMIYDATASQEVYSFNADTLMSPASCMKLLTCITALKKFGTSCMQKTRLYTSGTMVNDTLVGDITLKTQFDPVFNRDSLYKMTEVLTAKGIKHLKGRVVLDMADYTLMSHEQHWTPGDLRTRYLGLPFSGGAKLQREMLYALTHAGIAVQSKDIVYGRLNYSKFRLVAEIHTPMRISIEKALKNSSNINAEALLYPLGYIKSKKGTYRTDGIKVLKEFIGNELHMPIEGSCVIDDGCGLCPNDKLTPRLLVNLLAYAYMHKRLFKEVYYDLPLSGTDGTLHDRLYKKNVVGKIKAKTGTLTKNGGISSLSGYFTGNDGHMIIFSIINNECPIMDGRQWQDKLLTSMMRGE